VTVTLIGLLFFSCDKKINGQSSDVERSHIDSLAKPKVDIKVNRRFDDKGNMIGFDSTYTSYYSNLSGDTAQMDSLMSSFDNFFLQGHPSFFQRQFNPLFFNDSTRYPDFFHDDFFMKRYELNDRYMRDMMKRMDSIKNNFYKESHKEQKSKTDT
jgi:hypothetical protein